MPGPFQALILLLGSYLLARPLATSFHELGHLLAGLLIFRDHSPLTVHLGSLGHAKPLISFRLGRIFLNINKHWFWMRGSITVLPKIPSSGGMAFFALAGPIASLLFATACSLLALLVEFPWAIRTGLLLAAFIALIDIAYAFFHRFDAIPTESGQVAANDGQLLQWALKYRQHLPYLLAANAAFLQERYALAFENLEHLRKEGIADQEDIHCQAYSAFALGNLEQAANILNESKQKFKPQPEDHLLSAQIQMRSGKPDAARKEVEEGLKLAPGNTLLINQKAYLLIIIKDFASALPLLQKAIQLEAKYGLAQLNLAACHLALGQLAEAEKCLELATEQESDNLNYLLISLSLQRAKKNLTAAKSLETQLQSLGMHQDFD